MDTTLQASPKIAPVRRQRRRRVFTAFGVIVAFILAFLWWVGILSDNVREVDAGRFYRSGQLTGSGLETILHRYQIKSVLNLRGPSKRSAYLSETKVCRDLGVEHADLSLSAYRLPRPAEARDILSTLDRLPRPVLVHCQQGADRSGLVSTIYANLYGGKTLDQAEAEQLSWRYGHFGFVGTWRMEQFFDLYRKTSHGQDLRTWIARTYPSVYAGLGLKS